MWPEGPTAGGTVTYSSRAARAFVPGVKVLTAADADFDTRSAFPDISVCRVDAPATTQFRNIYTPAGRVQMVSPCPVTLQPANLTSDMRRSRIAHLAPVCNEVSAAIVDAVDRETFVGITPQGWMRRWDQAGRVTSRADNWVDAGAVLARANAVVISIDDVAGDWDVARRWAAQTPLLVVTQGALGCTAFSDHSPIHVPAPTVQEVEPTGAGDIFATVLFIALQRGDALWAACEHANCIAAQSVTRPRLAGVPTEHDITLCNQMSLQ
ncbi:MAG: PfkB family carbohydrate kinase [Chloroflexi bacterium]|nr:PfkB family carbohydrate kinase [Chloroflexota bacterium]MCL5273381.1 PfkB family carbohydrate kinase [Chloroflexota bacterium]